MRSAVVIAMLLLAGCGDPPAPRPSCDMADAMEPQRSAVFDGGAALAWVEAIVYEQPGQLRPRTPEAPRSECTAGWLEQALDQPGWATGVQVVLGADYAPIAAVKSWADPPACTQDEKEAVAQMAWRNVYAHYDGPGTVTILLGAHWDQKEDADDGGIVPGANDGASGMGVLLELQRSLQGTEIPVDLVIAFFDAEDGFEDCHPLGGSIAFAADMPVPVDRMILLDMVGDPEARFPREGNSVRSDPAMVEAFWSRAADHGLAQNFVDVQRSVVDDHLPFIDAGVPSIDIIDYARPAGEGRSGFPPYWHTTADTPDKLSADMMGKMGLLVRDVLLSL